MEESEECMNKELEVGNKVTVKENLVGISISEVFVITDKGIIGDIRYCDIESLISREGYVFIPEEYLIPFKDEQNKISNRYDN